MPAKSKAQQRLMGAAAHGAAFPKAQQLQQTMTRQQLHDFASGSMAGKPVHVGPHPHRNLGHYLHPKKGR